VHVETVPTGAAFDDECLSGILYQQYLNVFYQGKHHFDKISLELFRSILTGDAGGVVFLYSLKDRLIGYNICFKYEGKFVDKYVGFEYPLARENNLFFVSWFNNLEYALAHRLSHYIAGYNSPEVKADLGAHFTTSRHAVYVRNPLLRKVLVPFSRLVANDAGWTGSTPDTRQRAG
jgi:predicted N-acyltransferase